MKPVNNNVLILPDKPKKSFIITKDKIRPDTGTVIEVGHLVKDLKPKDRVVFNSKHVNVYEVKKQEVYLIDRESVHAKIED